MEDKVINSLNWRYAVKKFDPSRKVSEADWSVLEEALRLTPSSYGMQPWKFIVAKNSETRKRLRAAAWNQSQVEDASHFVVFTAKNEVTRENVNDYLQRIADTRKISIDKLGMFRDFLETDLFHGQRSKMIKEWTARQNYIALGNLMTTAALLGIDTCPMEGIEPDKFDEILGLKDSGYRTIVACAVGYRSIEDHHQHAAKVRYEKHEVFELK